MTYAGATEEAGIDTRRSRNDAAIAAIRVHHAELAEQVGTRTAAVLEAARTGRDVDNGGSARDELHAWYREQLMPHILAEELALYAPAAELDVTRLLVCGMLAEHIALVALMADLALAPTGFTAATAAAAAQALFTIHLDKENDLLLPALAEAGLDLASALTGMHEALATTETTGVTGTTSNHAHGCGCGHAHDDAAEPGLTPVPVLAVPAEDRGTVDDPPAAAGELDVRTLPHGQRHEVIFGRLQALEPGDALLIVNDHDPKPLRYQTEALWPGRFTWSYREAGPQRWRVAITRAG